MSRLRLLFVLGATLTLQGAIVESAAHAAPDPALSCTDLAFPGAPACRDYLGDAWAPGTASADCAAVPGAGAGTFVVGASCDTSSIVGVCTVDAGGVDETRLSFYGGDVGALEGACISALGGEWSAAAIAGRCDHETPFGPPGSPLEPVCKQYSGAGWDTSTADADCATLTEGSFSAGAACATSPLGTCTIGDGTDDEYSLHYYTGDAGALQGACETILAGVWTAAGSAEDDVLPEALDALASDDVVTVVPDDCVEDDCVAALVAANGAITFSPAGAAPTVGLVFYPGGNVDPRAYAVAARAIAEHGFLVAIVPFPGDLAIADPMRATYVIAAHPEIERWAIAGHSLGGVTASIYASVDPLGAIEGLALWAAVLPDTVDLSTGALKGLTVYATLDVGLPRPDYEASFDRLPERTLFVDIRGGSHEQFGYYTRDDGTPPATISRAFQHDLFTGATAHLLRRLGVPDELDVIDPSYAALPDVTDQVCATAQRLIAGFHRRDLKLADIVNTTYDDLADYSAARPEFPDGEAMVSVVTYRGQVANATDITAPPVYDGEIFCKMKSQEAIGDQYDLVPRHEEGSCALVNELVYAWTLGELDIFTVLKLWFAGVGLELVDDHFAASGPEFLAVPVSLVAAATPNAYALQAVRLQVPLVVPPPFGGGYYCKLWSPTSALAFVHRALAAAGW